MDEFSLGEKDRERNWRIFVYVTIYFKYIQCRDKRVLIYVFYMGLADFYKKVVYL